MAIKTSVTGVASVSEQLYRSAEEGKSLLVGLWYSVLMRPC